MAITSPPLPRRLKLLGASVEGTAGTKSIPSSALAGMLIYDAKMGPDNLFPEARTPHGKSIGAIDRAKGPLGARCSFRWEMAHADALMTLLQGCGFALNSGSTVATPTSNIANWSTLSLALWEAGRKKSMYGCMGDLTIEGTFGQRVFGTANFTGIWDTVADDAMPSFTRVHTTGYRAAGATFTIGAAAVPLVSQFTLALNTNVGPRQSIIASSGLLHALVNDPIPTLRIDPEARLVAGHDAYGLLLAGTTGALVLTLVDAAGNSLAIAGPRLQRIEIEDGERDAKLTDPVTLEFHDSADAGDDCLTFTKAAA